MRLQLPSHFGADNIKERIMKPLIIKRSITTAVSLLACVCASEPIVAGAAPAFTESTVHSFSLDEGSPPVGLILGNDGNYYGTSSGGGTAGMGTVFAMTPAGQVTVLHNFTGADGDYPSSALFLASDASSYVTGSVVRVDGGLAI